MLIHHAHVCHIRYCHRNLHSNLAYACSKADISTLTNMWLLYFRDWRSPESCHVRKIFKDKIEGNEDGKAVLEAARKASTVRLH